MEPTSNAGNWVLQNGEIYVRPNVGLDSELQNAMQVDIDDVLHLNGEKRFLTEK